MKRQLAVPLFALLSMLPLLGVSCASSTRSVAGDQVAVLQKYFVRDLVLPSEAGKPAFIATDDLVTNLRDATGRERWANEEYRITAVDSDYLVVRASPGLHRIVETVLSDMRRFADAR